LWFRNVTRQTFHLTADVRDRETIERALDVYEDGCPVARSIKSSIEITSELLARGLRCAAHP
jgi:uncharacterized OsmC-like protein